MKPKLGKLAFLIGKRMEGDPDYEAAKQEEAAEREAHQKRAARYNELAAQGLSDGEIEKIMEEAA